MNDLTARPAALSIDYFETSLNELPHAGYRTEQSQVNLQKRVQRLRVAAGFLGRFHLAKARAMLASSKNQPVHFDLPEVTLCVVNHDSEDTLLLLLSTMKRTLLYPKWHLIIADNTPTLRSKRLLQSVPRWLKNPKSITFWEESKPVPHAIWLDRFMNESTTPYWIHVDSDIILLSGDCIYDFMNMMHIHPDCGLLSAEAKPASFAFREPFDNILADGAVAPSTWLMAARREMRDLYPPATFAVEIDRLRERPLIYDTGAKLVSSLPNNGLKHCVMPSWFQQKYYHFGSLSWFRDHIDSSSRYFSLKEFQIAWISSQVRRKLPQLNFDG